MIRSQRLATIVDMVHESGTVSVEEIITELGVSPATARRDLDALAAQGALRRTRGGACTPSFGVDNSYQPHRDAHLSEKNTIADYCLTILEPGCVIGVSGGSTAGVFAAKIPAWVAQQQRQHPTWQGPLITIVTNAVDIAYQVGRCPQIKMVIIGGVLNCRSFELTGPVSVSNMQHFSLDICFLGANGVDHNGPGTVDEFEASTNATMSSRARDTYVIADSSKFGRRSFSSLGAPGSVTAIITDDGVSEQWVSQVRDAGYPVVVALDDDPASQPHPT